MPLRRPVLACALLRCLGVAVLAGGAAPAASAQDLTVSAAASLAGAMREIAAAFAAAHPGAKVNLNLAGSNALLAQIAQGAPVDVFASADPQTMDRAADRKLIAPATRRNFAGNRLVLVVPSAAASPPVALADLARPAVRRIAIGSRSCGCGSVATMWHSSRRD